MTDAITLLDEWRGNNPSRDWTICSPQEDRSTYSIDLFSGAYPDGIFEATSESLAEAVALALAAAKEAGHG